MENEILITWTHRGYEVELSLSYINSIRGPKGVI